MSLIISHKFKNFIQIYFNAKITRVSILTWVALNFLIKK